MNIEETIHVEFDEFLEERFNMQLLRKSVDYIETDIDQTIEPQSIQIGEQHIDAEAHNRLDDLLKSWPAPKYM